MSSGNSTPVLVVTGASGQLGRGVTTHLLERVDAERLVLVSRTPEQLSEMRAAGADVRFGDFEDPASLVAAFAGGERLLLISTDAPGRRVAQHGNAIEAAARAGVRHILYTSVLNPSPDNPSSVTGDHRATEALIRESGLAWTMLRNGFYGDLQLAEARAAIEYGTFSYNSGDGRTAYVSRDDCAAAAAVLLAGPGHDGACYDITGPESLCAEDLAEIYAALGGGPVVATAVDDTGFVEGLVAVGLPHPVAEMLASFGRAIRGGHVDQVSTTVAELTGRPASRLQDVLESALRGA